MLSWELMMEMARRAQDDGQPWRSETAALAHEAGRQAAYCLDAPDDIPAGGMCSDSDSFKGMTLAVPMVVDRDADNR